MNEIAEKDIFAKSLEKCLELCVRVCACVLCVGIGGGVCTRNDILGQCPPLSRMINATNITFFLRSLVLHRGHYLRRLHCERGNINVCFKNFVAIQFSRDEWRRYTARRTFNSFRLPLESGRLGRLARLGALWAFVWDQKWTCTSMGRENILRLFWLELKVFCKS